MLQRESLDFFGIEEKQYGSYFLVDYKTREYFKLFLFLNAKSLKYLKSSRLNIECQLVRS